MKESLKKFDSNAAEEVIFRLFIKKIKAFIDIHPHLKNELFTKVAILTGNEKSIL